ncbi:dol-P-Glc:Glc(2)Man(9)GlcNAc(2)-PP-Dol alpha-1,2-glucosyltransferase isoform X1 [Quercus suber]|uniref:dol-P-Glc:Glc(2)Man(9)GlcNAc(2)-PP-Dol alpha-1,2-glucosyltransferase isoform X2 n=2 Tax=Quercus suber TaxID=58331 RepID=UPI000CE1D942|nr:dol-P-Glc:Glc(2)Man(9)GlcNAc(2)-PP-Dol alpha-1,2-glucosyltransferase-like isoform X1 [Quercus suber]XP_023874824.1 dol-P-Glc:Glc(2)Man(9)GlcNAc(2)-PP-Dol alpha-1,2-glucosyltransferase-like isoform X2 [Quercus suber]
MGRVAVAVIVSLWVISVSILVNRIVPEPYMDEIFHIPQAQQYCIANFRSWDPMITTPPGLYYLSLVHVASLFPSMFMVQAASSFSEVCTTAILRSVNGVLAVLCSIIVYEIITLLRPTLSERKATIFAVVLALYPLHWFFTFLYYTDVASLTAVLAMYLACLKKSYWCSAMLGALAVVIRQTNIVWMLFVAFTGVINITLVHPRDNVEENNIDTAIRKTNRSTSNDNVTSNSNLRRRKFSNALGTDKQSMPSASFFSTNHSSGLLNEVEVILLALWHRKWELLVSFSPFLMVFVAFLAFVHWNGSVVLGAKEAHTVSPHFAQIMYFGLVSALAVSPLHCSIGQIVDLFQSFWKRRPISFFQVLIAVTAGFFSVHFYSIAHPYLIADNRHYPFYLWRKVINAHWSMKYLLVPLYVYSWFSILSALGKVQRKIWILAFFLATAAVLVPAPLIELRYYTIPLYFMILHSHINDYQSWLLMGLIYLALNVFTMTIFLFRPFHWDHEPGIQRFIW